MNSPAAATADTYAVERRWRPHPMGHAQDSLTDIGLPLVNNRKISYSSNQTHELHGTKRGPGLKGAPGCKAPLYVQTIAVTKSLSLPDDPDYGWLDDVWMAPSDHALWGRAASHITDHVSCRNIAGSQI
jgi:hypothetical protein